MGRKNNKNRNKNKNKHKKVSYKRYNREWEIYGPLEKVFEGLVGVERDARRGRIGNDGNELLALVELLPLVDVLREEKAVQAIHR